MRKDGVGKSQCGDKDLRRTIHFAIPIAQRHAGKVKVGTLARDRVVPVNHILIGLIDRQLSTKHAVTNTLRMALSVLAPQ